MPFLLSWDQVGSQSLLLIKRQTSPSASFSFYFLLL